MQNIWERIFNSSTYTLIRVSFIFDFNPFIWSGSLTIFACATEDGRLVSPIFGFMPDRPGPRLSPVGRRSLDDSENAKFKIGKEFLASERRLVLTTKKY